MRSRLSGKKTKTLSGTAQRACRRRTGFPNWQLGTFREVIPSVSSCGRIEKQFSMLMPLTKSQTKVENYENRSSFTQTRLLQPQLCASLQTGFCFFFRLCLPRFSYARFMLFLFDDGLLLGPGRGERERTFRKSTDLR